MESVNDVKGQPLFQSDFFFFSIKKMKVRSKAVENINFYMLF